MQVYRCIALGLLLVLTACNPRGNSSQLHDPNRIIQLLETGSIAAGDVWNEKKVNVLERGYIRRIVNGETYLRLVYYADMDLLLEIYLRDGIVFGAALSNFETHTPKVYFIDDTLLANYSSTDQKL